MEICAQSLKRFRIAATICLFIDLAFRYQDSDLLYNVGGISKPSWFSWFTFLNLHSPTPSQIILVFLVQSFIYILFWLNKFPLLGSFSAFLSFFLLCNSSIESANIQDFVLLIFLLQYSLAELSLKLRGYRHVGIGPSLFITLFFVIIYSSSGLSKLYSPIWNRGAGLYEILTLPYSAGGLSVLINESTKGLLFYLNYIVILSELFIAVCLCINSIRVRKYTVIAAISFHIGITLFMNVGLFSAFMITGLMMLWPCHNKVESKPYWTDIIPIVLLCICLVSFADGALRNRLGMNNSFIAYAKNSEIPFQPLWFGMYTQNHVLKYPKRMPTALIAASSTATKEVFLDELISTGSQTIPLSNGQDTCARGYYSSYLQRKMIYKLLSSPDLIEHILKTRGYLPSSSHIVGFRWSQCNVTSF